MIKVVSVHMQCARPASVRSSDVFFGFATELFTLSWKCRVPEAVQAASVASEQRLARTSQRHISSRTGNLYEPTFATATRWDEA